jgi:hypothetical protein
LYEVQPAETSEGVNGMFETSKMTGNGFSIQVVSKTLTSVVWPFWRQLMVNGSAAYKSLIFHQQ